MIFTNNVAALINFFIGVGSKYLQRQFIGLKTMYRFKPQNKNLFFNKNT